MYSAQTYGSPAACGHCNTKFKSRIIATPNCSIWLQVRLVSPTPVLWHITVFKQWIENNLQQRNKIAQRDRDEKTELVLLLQSLHLYDHLEFLLVLKNFFKCKDAFPFFQKYVNAINRHLLLLGLIWCWNIYNSYFYWHDYMPKVYSFEILKNKFTIYVPLQTSPSSLLLFISLYGCC